MIEDSGFIDLNEMCSKLFQSFDFLCQELGKLVRALFQTVMVGMRTMAGVIFRRREFGHGVRPGEHWLDREPSRLAGWRGKMTPGVTREAVVLYEHCGV